MELAIVVANETTFTSIQASNTGGTTAMQATELLLEQVKFAHWWIENIVEAITPEHAHWHPPATIVNSIGSNYAHLLVYEDLVINAIMKGDAPLYASSWAGKTGMSTLPPMPTPENPGLPNWLEWSKQVTFDLGSLRTYAQATFAATEKYFASLSDEQMHQTVDLTLYDLGHQEIHWTLSVIIVGHTFAHGGEIACLKGLQGMKGFPL
jgi:hypothetical protein